MGKHFIGGNRVKVIANLPLAKAGLNSEVTGIVASSVFDQKLNCWKFFVRFDNSDSFLIEKDYYFGEELELIQDEEYAKGYKFGIDLSNGKSESYLSGVFAALFATLGQMTYDLAESRLMEGDLNE